MKRLKNKKFVQGVLLVIVLVTWGYIGFYFLKDTEEPFVEIATPTKKKANTSPKTSLYTLMINYPDPFSREIESEEEIMDREEEIAQNTPPPLPPPPVLWPTIEYHGMVVNKRDKSEVALITVNGKQQLLKKNQSIYGVKLDRLFLDSARFSYSGEHRTFLNQ